jgi:hypothetical protein
MFRFKRSAHSGRGAATNIQARSGENQRRLKADDFDIPRKISKADFAEIIRIYNIKLASQQYELKTRLDDLVEAFSEWMNKGKQEPSRKSQSDQIKKALVNVKNAAKQIDRLGPSGRAAFRAISPIVGPMLAARWISEKFPDDPFAPLRQAPQNSFGIHKPMRHPMRAKEYFIEELTHSSRAEFVSHRPAETASAVLKEIENGLNSALRALALQPGAKGGPKPLRYRHWLIINLAEMWNDLNKEVSTGPNSDFAAFCETVAVSLGWPHSGMSSAISQAGHDWRNLPGKTR